MKEENAIVFIVDDDLSIRESLRNLRGSSGIVQRGSSAETLRSITSMTSSG